MNWALKSRWVCDQVVGPEGGITVGLSLIVTVLGPFVLGDPNLAEGRHGVFGTGGVVRRGDFG